VSFNANMTGSLGVGQRIKLTQATVKYFIVTAVGTYTGGATLVTLYGGTDYTLTSDPITAIYYSRDKAPLGFPLDRNKWKVEVTDTSNRSQASPVNGTWYNLGTTNCQITIPIGLWEVEYSVVSDPDSGSQYTSLSTSDSAESDTDFTVFSYNPNEVAATSGRRKFLSLAAKTLYYLIAKTQSAAPHIYFANASVKMIIRAVCAYL
jgi:hypothetical protein